MNGVHALAVDINPHRGDWMAAAGGFRGEMNWGSDGYACSG
jgi:hypothetical protein